MKDDLCGPASTPAGCPVCQARFRGSAQCSRCGANLSPLMLLAAHAYTMRQSARRALRQGDCASAQDSAKAAQRLHSTAEGNLLTIICNAAASALSEKPQKTIDHPIA
jgi:hypothetical protein